jgi:WD40 repeat protein
MSALSHEELRGLTVGRYALLEPISQGGFGDVYLAEQREPRRRVAIKLIRSGLRGTDLLERFKAEQQALASMNHPGIVAFFDFGTTDDSRPYFVMEYIKGLPITEYCVKHRLEIRQRLELFRQVCDAVEYAHRKGVIHRDIKPANVLVTSETGQPVAKVIDFGLVEAASQPLTDDDLHTRYGCAMGTLEYMSPEQARMSREGIDCRTDVYSLGALLYELLTGTIPFDGRSLGREKLLRAIEADTPAKPSDRVMGPGGGTAERAASRRSDAARLRKALHRELDWITLKALAKEPDERYDSARELSEDIGRYLRKQVVVAGSGSFGYRLRRFAERRWGSLTAAAAVGMLLFVAALITHESARKASQSNFVAEHRQLEVERHAATERSLELAQEAAKRIPDRLDLALLLSLEAIEAADTTEARGSLLAALLADRDLVTFLHGHLKGVMKLAWSADGRLLASCGSDGLLIFWDAETHQMFGKPMPLGHGNPLFALAFGRKSGELALAVPVNAVQLFRVDPPGCFGVQFQRHPSDIRSIEFSPDGRTIASSDSGGSIIYGPADPNDQARKCIPGESPQYRPLAFAPDGLTFAAADRGDAIGIWETKTGKRCGVAMQGHSEPVCTLDFSPDGQTVASGGADGAIVLWDVASGAARSRSMDSKRIAVMSLSYNRDGSLLASGQWDGTVLVWDANSDLRLQTTHEGQLGMVQSVAFNPRNDLLAGAGDRGRIAVWDAAGACSPWRRFRGSASGFSRIACSHDGTIAASGNNRGGIILWNTIEGKQVGRLPSGYCGQIADLAFSPSGKILASCSLGGARSDVLLWNIGESDAVPQKLTGCDGPMAAVAFSPDGSLVYAGGMSYRIWVWRVATGQLVGSVETNAVDSNARFVKRLAFSGDGRFLVAGCSADALIFDAKSGKPIGKLAVDGRKAVSALAFVPGSSLLAAGYWDGSIRLWDVTSHKQVLPALCEHSANVQGLSFSQDGKLLMSSDPSGSILLWDVGSRKLLGRLARPATLNRTDIALCPGAGQVLSGSDRDGIIAWDLRLNSWKAAARRIANRNMSRNEWERYMRGATYHKTCPDLPGPDEDRNLTQEEWRRLFGDESYRRSFPDSWEPN